MNLTTLKLTFFVCCSILALNNVATAQIIPDNTLGAESSRVLPNGAIDKIDGGALRDKNLFHSFKEFNINNGQSVYFNNPSGIENILTRVTGGNASNILGTLGVDGAANLFLINPTGIVFGENARLDLGGSFVGTTANRLQFGEQGDFSATNPQAPGLLTVNPDALFFNQINQNAEIINSSFAPAGVDPAGFDAFGLRVPDGKNLLLVGGNVSIDGGGLNALGGRIELGGLTEAGSIGIESNEDNFSLSFPDGVQRGDISINNGSLVSVIGSGDSSIAANAKNLEILGGSQIASGIGSGLGTTNAQAGDITVDVTGQIKLAGTNSLIFNSVQPQAVGNAGNITINTGSLEVKDGAQINSFTSGQGNAGNITIQARDAVTFDGVDSNGFSSGSFADVFTGGIGNAGDINITAGSLYLTNGGIIRSSIFGKGDSGNISITAGDAISLDASSYILNNVQSIDAVGNAGKIDITTGSLSLTNGARINSFTRGQGNAGNITIQARDTVTFDGINSNGFSSGSFGDVLTGGVGNGAEINITAGSLSLTNGGIIRSSIFGKGDSGNISITAGDAISLDASSYILNNVQSIDAVGNAGKIDITTGSLSLTNGARINSFTRGQGNAGNITIQARDAVTFDGIDSNGFFSGSFADVLTGGVGNAGDINITAGSFKIINRAGIFANTLGKGNGGNITVEARDLVEILSDGNLESDVKEGAIGNSGNITIKTTNLIVRDSQIGPSVFGEGNAGNFKIIATDSVKLSGQRPKREDDTSNAGSVGFPGGLFAQIDLTGKGRGGNLTIETRHLSVSDGSKIQAATFGDGDAGNVFIRASEIDLFETEKPNFFSTGIFAGVQTDGRVEAGIIDPRDGRLPKGNGGNLTIEARKLSIRDGADVFVQTTGEGDAGKIFIRAKESVNVMGVSTGALETQRTSRITAAASERSTGNGGSLTIETPLLNVANGGFISSNSQGKGIAGDIDINSDIVRLNNGKIIAQTASKDGGNINFNFSQYLLLRNNSQISTTAGNQQFGGNGGNITIDSPFIVALPNENSDITANAFTGNGGNINITSQGILGIQPRSQLTPQSDITASSETGITKLRQKYIQV
ncbi:MAG: filamentous hemagglutinin N-terminal domain-containing protein [Cyanobacteria bacterium P01_D01_bin.116]